jgi:hypothetical protein
MNRRSEPSAATYVMAAGLFLLAALVVYRDHPLVVIHSSRPGEALFATGELQPGQSSSTSITLSNGGVLPFTYSLAVERPGGGQPTSRFRLEIRRHADGRVLYRGPLAADTGALGELAPGQSVPLDLTISLPAGGGGQLGLNLYFKWHGHATLLAAWWLNAVAAGLALALGGLAILLLRELRQPAGSVPSEQAG